MGIEGEAVEAAVLNYYFHKSDHKKEVRDWDSN